MRLREYSEIGYLMQQWLGVLVPEAEDKSDAADLAESQSRARILTTELEAIGHVREP